MRICWIEDIEYFKTIKNEWDQALRLSEADNPFLLSDLIISWWRIFSQNRRLKIFVLYENSSIVGGFPLYSKKLPLGKAKLLCLQQVGDDYANITEPFYVLNSDLFTDYFFRGLKRIRGWNLLHLQRLKTDFLGISRSAGGHFSIEKKNQVRSVVRISDTNPLIKISQDAKSYLETRGKKLRKNVRYYRRKAQEVGEVSLDKINDISEIMSYFKMYVDFSIKSRIDRNQSSAYEDKRMYEVTKNIINTFAKHNYIDAHVLKLGDEIAAISFGYRYGQGYKYIFPCYNPKFSSISPGYILIYELINYAFNNNDPYFDMYSGSNVFYKKQWCDTFIPLYNVKIFNNNLLGIMGYLAHR